LSDESTRVRISYTVNLDEVPERIASLMDEAGDSLAGLPDSLYDTAKCLFEDNNITSALKCIDEVRTKMMEADVRLEDCMSLLVNYQSTQAEISIESARTGESQEDIE
jgi:hypothetical protein